jgi:hypothetical protein
MTATTGAVALLLGTIAATPRSPFGGWLFVAQMAGAQFFMTGVITIRTALWRSNYPATVRGQATARFQMIRAVTAMLAVATAGTLFDAFPDVYRIVYPAIAACGLTASFLVRRIRVRGEKQELGRLEAAAATALPDRNRVERVSPLRAANPLAMLPRAYTIFRQDRLYARYLISLMSAGIGNLLVRAVVIIVISDMLTAMGRGTRAILISTVLLDVIPKAVMLLSVRYMGHWFDRIGVLRFRVANGCMWLASIVTGTAATVLVVHADRLGPAALWAAAAIFTVRAACMGLGYASGSMAYNLGHLHFAHPERAELYMGVHVTLSGLRGLTMPGLGLLLWVWIGWPTWLIAIAFSTLGLVGYILLARGEDPSPSGHTTGSPST